MKDRTAKLLGFAGLIPFGSLLLVSMAGPDHWQDTALFALMAWGSVIAAFLGGINWGTALAHSSARLYVMSIIPFMAAWIALLLPVKHALWLLVLTFMIALLNDHAIYRAGLIPEWFSKMRQVLSVAVITTLAIAAALA